MTLAEWEIALRLLIATATGVLFGYEREKSGKSVGVRTHVLIILASCAIAMISAYGFQDAIDRAAGFTEFRSDPARLVVGILTGIGFIGAGIIWRNPGEPVRGITTAAEIFLLAALGIAVGLGQYFLFILTTAFAYLALVSDNLIRRSRERRQRKLKRHADAGADAGDAADETPSEP